MNYAEEQLQNAIERVHKKCILKGYKQIIIKKKESHMDNCEWIKEKHKGILEIYPRKCLNTFVLESKLNELQKDYDLVQIFPDWIRAFKK